MWCKLEDIVDYEQPTSYIVSSTEYDYSFVTPVLTAGKSFVIGRTNETNGIFSNLPCIIFDDFTTDSKYVDFPFKVKSSAMKILKVKNEISTKYVAMFMSITRLAGKTHKRYWISEYSKLRIPIPPKNEQQRILKELHKWISLIEYVEQEKVDLQSYIIQTKKKILDLAIHGKLIPQDPADEPASELLKRVNPNAEITSDNEHYPQLPAGWCIAPMKILCSLEDGRKEKNNERFNIDVKFLRGERNAKIINNGRYICANSLLILVDGENSGEVFRTPIEGYQGSTFKRLIINELMCEEYLLNVISLHRKVLRENKVGSAIPHLNKKLFKEIEVPIPPYNEQKRIAEAIKNLFNNIDNIAENL